MIISFGRWSSAADKYTVRKRLYIRGYIWTPFVRVLKRSYFNISPSEALYGFCGWLTSRDEETMNDPSAIADLVEAYCDANNLAPPRDLWHHFIITPDD